VKYCDTCHGTFSNEPSVCPRDQAVLRHVTELAPGMTIREKYEIVEKIGSGGMAVVYKVRHRAFGEVFAIKVVSPILADNEEFLNRFKNEAIITRRLRHPNAVRVDDLDTTEDGRPFIVMEYVAGQSLRKIIQTEGAMPVPRALAIAKQAAQALAAAHQLQIVHRDIKPDNVLLVSQPDGTDVAKVLDFGIAKVREGTMQLVDGYTPTQTGMIVGTPQYISPEQALGMRGDDIDGRADLYSLGVVLYELLTGELPFHSDTPMGMMLHHIQTPARPPRELRPDVAIPQTLSDVLMKMLAKDPGRRFQTADELVVALGRPHDVGLAKTTLGVKPAALPDAVTAARPPRPRTPPQTFSRRPTPPPEPMDLGGGEGFAPNRTVMLVGVVALLAAGLAALWPSPPARPINLRRPAVAAQAPADPATAVAKSADAPTQAPAEAPVAAGIDDAQIAVDVNQRLSDSPTLKGAHIDVAVEKGVVVLTGRATVTQTEVAVALTKTAGGVVGVKVGLRPAEAEAAPAEPAGDPKVQELVNEGYALLDRGEANAAVSKFRAALELQPEHATARLGMERAKAKLGGR
jgi:serine/threonine protein kinase/osmotically-inducible protein OsmY